MGNLRWSGGAGRPGVQFLRGLFVWFGFGSKRPPNYPGANDEPKGTSSCPGGERKDETHPVTCTSDSESGSPGERVRPFQAEESCQLLPGPSNKRTEGKKASLLSRPWTSKCNPPGGCCSCFLLNIFVNPSRNSAWVNGEVRSQTC